MHRVGIFLRAMSALTLVCTLAACGGGGGGDSGAAAPAGNGLSLGAQTGTAPASDKPEVRYAP